VLGRPWALCIINSTVDHGVRLSASDLNIELKQLWDT
jgi:hypothetical protein